MTDASSKEQDEMIAQFCAVGGEKADPAQARSVLESTGWNLEEALALFFEPEDSPPTANTSGNVPTGSSSAAEASSHPDASTGSSAGRPSRSGPHTLKDFQGEGRSRDESGDDDDENYGDENEQDFFAGGEKSGLAVQNPGSSARDHVSNILKRARR